jgi:hypothetical protein
MTKDEALKEALANYMAAFGQSLEAHGIPYGQQQIDADKQAREALVQPDPVLAEREACAKLCEEKPKFRTTLGGRSISEVVGGRLAEAIRARGQE